jgi:hypothetical protein
MSAASKYVELENLLLEELQDNNNALAIAETHFLIKELREVMVKILGWAEMSKEIKPYT